MFILHMKIIFYRNEPKIKRFLLKIIIANLCFIIQIRVHQTLFTVLLL